MRRSGPRITLVALAVLAVAFGGALFPSSGFGSAPAEETELIGTDVPAEPTDRLGTDAREAEPAGADEPETDGEPTPVSTIAEGDAATPSPTPEPTPTATATPVPDDGDSSGGGGAIGLLSWLFGGGLLVLAAVAMVASLSSWLGDGGSGDGPTLGPLSFGWAFGGGGVSPAGLVKRVPQATMVALVGASTGTARVLSTAGSAASDAAAGLATVLGGGSRATGSLLAGLGGLFSSGGSLVSVTGILSGLASGGSGGASGSAPDADARTTAPVEPESSDDPIRTVEGAWEAFADPLPVRDREARTPGELARTAIDRGDPADPVERLRDVFRDVRYGGAPASDDRTRTAVEAARDVLSRREDEE
ncbi:DUF4129 domain-containing protein [Halosimplex pelagicum]|uniref:DUF4129 domain-containing protein n=1 Tax=Halosimplex pelagicum TaxID=869886 RepID=A0A7D5PC44_9EURY|nr:DUF4129 domain-containing protein [Halosimplex pelagicum]QLH84324.1 DUF4129 domain-containing protein [Halosimplex pelagicum]